MDWPEHLDLTLFTPCFTGWKRVDIEMKKFDTHLLVYSPLPAHHPCQAPLFNKLPDLLLLDLV